MNAPRLGIDVGRQCIRIGGAQLGELAPLQHRVDEAARVVGQLLVVGELVEQARARLPLPCLGLLAAGQFSRSNSSSPSCCGEPRLNLCPTRPLISSSSRATPCANWLDSRDSTDGSTLMPVRSMSEITPSSGRSSVSYTVIMRSAASRGFSIIHSRSVTSASSAAYSVALSNGTWPKVLPDFFAPGANATTCSNVMHVCCRCFSASEVHAVLPAPAVERVGDQHGVVDVARLDAVAREHRQVELDVVADLEDRRVLHHALQRGDGIAHRDLLEARMLAEVERIGSRAMAERHVAGHARPHREREAHQLRHHRIDIRRLGVDGDAAHALRRRHPLLQTLELRHRLVFRAINWRRGLARDRTPRPLPAYWRRCRSRTAFGASPLPAPVAAPSAPAPGSARPAPRQCAW